LIGVLLGFAAGAGLRYLDMAVIFSPLPAIFAFSCAFGTGLLFGYLPARKAAGLDPVVALAAE
jgi:macrolide transport system ATP-binding/permease protein